MVHAFSAFSQTVNPFVCTSITGNESMHVYYVLETFKNCFCQQEIFAVLLM